MTTCDHNVNPLKIIGSVIKLESRLTVSSLTVNTGLKCTPTNGFNGKLSKTREDKMNVVVTGFLLTLTGEFYGELSLYFYLWGHLLVSICHLLVDLLTVGKKSLHF